MAQEDPDTQMSEVRSEEDKAIEATPLHSAAAHGKLEDVKHLLTTDVKRVNSRDKRQRTPLHCAATKGHFRVVEYLLKLVAYVDSKDKDECTALHHAANLDVVKCLVKKGANVNSKDREKKTPLHYAAREGLHKVVDYLVKKGAQVNSKDKDEKTPLHYAAKNGKLSVVKLLLEGEAQVDGRVDGMWSGFFPTKMMTPLHYAAREGHCEVVKHLVDKGAQVNSKDKDNKAPLHYAAESGKLDVVTLLLQQGAQVDGRMNGMWSGFFTTKMMTPLHYAAREGHYEVVKHLVDKGARVNSKDKDDKTPLHYAAKNGKLNVVKLLLEWEAQVDGREDGRWSGFFTTKMMTPLHYAAREGHCEVVKHLVKKEAEVDNKDEYDKTPLHYAAMHGHLSVVKYLVEYLVEQGAPAISKKEHVNIKDKDKNTPLHYAALSGHQDVVNYLIEQEGDISSKEKDNVLTGMMFNQTTPLHSAAAHGKLEDVKHLLTENPKLVNSRDKRQCTALHYAANLDVVEYLVERRAYVNSKDCDKKTPLHYAAENNKLDIVKLLLERGAQVDGRMEGMWLWNAPTKMMTPLHYAAREGHCEVVKHLVKEGAEVTSNDKDDKTPLHYAAMHGHLSVVEHLVEQGAPGISKKEYVNSKDTDEKTPLHYAASSDHQDVASSGHQDVVKYLIEQEADVSSKDKFDKTPLHYAAMHGHLSVVEHLVEHLVEQGAPAISKKEHVDIKDENGKTPLYYAASSGHQRVVEFLIKQKADLNSKDKFDFTPVYKATRNRHDEVSKCLLKHGAEKGCVIRALIDDLETTIRRCDIIDDHEAIIRQINDHFQNFKGHFEKLGIETTELFREHKTSLLHSAVAAGSKEMVEELVKLGAEIDHHESNFEWKNVKYKQIAPLHLAAECGHDVIVELLLEKGAPADTEDHTKNTPLHAAASKGHQKIVKLLVKHGANVQHKFGFRKRTPLHFASYNGHTEAVDFLLEREADPTSVDFNGRNCLHLAIRANHKETVLRLLQHERWKEMLKKCDNFLETPLKDLIDNMPDVAEECFGRCIETNEGDPTSSMDKIRPTSEAYKVTFDYEFLQEVMNPDSLRCQGKSFKTTHPLYHISESENTQLLHHPLVTSLLKHKWDSFGHKLFFANLFIYVVFLVCLTGFALMALNPLEQTCGPGSEDGNGSIDQTGSIDRTGSIDGTGPEDCGSSFSLNRSFKYSVLAASTIQLAVFRLIMEMVQLIIHGPWAYLSDLVNYIEISLYVFSIIFTFELPTPWHRLQWQFGALAVFLGWLVLITFLQKWPRTGIYVIVFLKTMESFLNVAFLALLLVITFALPFYMQFFEPDKMRHAFIHPARAVVKVMSMTTGELDYDDIFHHKEGEEEVAFPMISFPLWIIFLVIMPVLLNNYLTGLAVGDVKQMLEQCQVNKARLQIDLVLTLEGMLKKFNLLYLFPPIEVQNGPILLNASKSFSDGHYTTGREIAEAIKPRAKPIEEQLEEKLKQQTMEQGKQLEKQLKEQTKEQVQQLEENLKQQSHEQGRQLEANLKQQNQEQVQKLEEKLKLQSEEHSKQLSKQSAKHSEQLQQLEGKLQEQIKQLANDVASMKELLMKLASK